MNRDLMQRIKGYLDSHKKKKRFIMSACALSLCTVLAVYGVLLQPAISMEKKQMLLTAEPDKGTYGDSLTAEVTAMAKPGQPETYFLISEKGDGAIFADDLMFDDDMAVLELLDGTVVEIHREMKEDGEDAQYWFYLEEGQEAEFVLDYISDEYGSGDAGAAGGSDGGKTDETIAAEVIESTAAEIEKTVAETPEVELTEAETPEAESTEAETPEAESPEAETPEAESTEAEMPEAESTEAETPEVETSENETTEAETTGAEPAETEASEVGTPEAETTEETSAVEIEESTAAISEHLMEMVRSAIEGEETEREDKATPSDADQPSAGGSSGTESEEEFTDKLTMKLRYSWGESLEECRKNLKDADELVLTWMSAEDLCKEGIASIHIETDADEAESGDVITAIVSASLTEEAEDEKIVSLMMNFDQAGLSDEYEFDGGVCELFDMAGESILLHRQRTDKKHVYQYWFTLQPGQETEFELLLTDGTEGYPVATASDATASDALQAVEAMALGEEEDADIEDMAEMTRLSVATPADALEEMQSDELLDANGNELVISGELELYAGVGSTRRLSGKDAFAKAPVYLTWFGEGTYILTCTLEDGVKVILTAPSGAFPNAKNLKLSVKKLEGEEAEQAQVILDQQPVEENYRLQTISLWDIKVLDDGNEVQPQKPVSVTFENLQEEGIETAPKILHLDHEKSQAVDMNATLDANGQVVMEADGFSPFAVVRDVDKGSPSGTATEIPMVEQKSANDFSPNNGLKIEDIDGKAEFIGTPESVRTGNHTDGKPYYRIVNHNPNENPNASPDKTSGNLWGGEWAETIWNPYKSFTQQYGALAVQFQGSDPEVSGYAMNYGAGWDQNDLTLAGTGMKAKVKYHEVGTYNGQPIGAIAEIKVTPSKNRSGGSWGWADYVGPNVDGKPNKPVYYPTVQISRSLYSGWVWQNIKEFHVDLTFYYLAEDKSWTDEKVILNNLDEDESPEYADVNADYYTIHSLNPAVEADPADGQRYGPEYVLPDDVDNVKAFSIGTDEWDSNIVIDYPSDDETVTGYDKQYAYNGGTGEWGKDPNDNEDVPGYPSWRQNSVMIMPATRTETIGFTMGSLMREPNKNMNPNEGPKRQVVPRTSHMWATISSDPIGRERQQTGLTVRKNWTDSSENNHVDDSVTVHLFADGVDTERPPLILNAGNGWEDKFEDLPVYGDDGTTKIKYTVVEDSVPGYITTITYDTGSSTDDGVWIPVTSFEEGGIYAVVYNGNKAVRNAQRNTLSSVNVMKGDNAIVIDGIAYPDYLTSVDGNAQWLAGNIDNTVSRQSRAVLTNRDTGKEIKAGVQNFTAETSGGTQLKYHQDSGKIQGAIRYMRNANGATTERNGTQYTLYKQTATSSSVVITNRPINPGGSKVSFEHNKTIDYLGDRETNPDTNLTGDDFYRLYLDMTGKQEGIDLLIVVDRSGSMANFADIKDGNSTRKRDAAVGKVLNGSYNGVTADGLISTFMNMNPKNRYAVVSFQGDTSLGYNIKPGGGRPQTSGNMWQQQRGYNYQKDSSGLVDWTSDIKNVNTSSAGNHGTNYEAGLLRAGELLKKAEESSNRKVMIFLSDGVPTYHIMDENVANVGSLGDRWGNGGYDNKYNRDQCKPASKIAFDRFKSNYPDVTTFTVGISKDASGTSEDESRSPEVLRYMAAQGGGQFIGAESTSELKEALEGFIRIYPKNVTITDNLSKYVDWYDAQPDVKVIRTNKDDAGEVEILYEKGAVTSAGTGKLQGVTYIPSSSPNVSGVVKAVFHPDYELGDEWIYTLSFNVKASQEAYDEYAENIETPSNNGYGDVKGDGTEEDPETDYPGNTTSSGKPGFHSNDSATVEYIVDDAAYKDEYLHPVIQVHTASLNVLKTSAEGNKPLAGVEFELYPVTVTEGVWGEPEEGAEPSHNATTDADGNLSLPGLRSGTYLLYETKAAPGFDLPDEPWRLTVEGSKLTLTTSDGTPIESTNDVNPQKLVFQIKNQESYKLPETGGVGHDRYITGGIFMMIFAGLLYIYTKKRREGSTPRV